MENIGTYLLQAVCIVAIGIITKVLVPYFQNLLEKDADVYLEKQIEIAVKAAEQKIQGLKMGEERKAYVVKLLKSCGIVVNDIVDAIIEYTVKKMKDEESKIVENLSTLK